MPKKSAPASALGRLPKTELVRTYVWEKPVRISHWLMFFAFLSLSFTGLYMHRPFLLVSGRASFLMARMRFVHVVSGFVLIAAIALRIYWFFKGNFWARWSSYIPIHREAMGGHRIDAGVLSLHAVRSRAPDGPQPPGRTQLLHHLYTDRRRDPHRVVSIQPGARESRVASIRRRGWPC